MPDLAISDVLLLKHNSPVELLPFLPGSMPGLSGISRTIDKTVIDRQVFLGNDRKNKSFVY